uniref:Uncharacterized protein n=1 Tax=Oryza nivara TaxID=4536 RepID=A0A0E0HS96_ORYNI
MDGWSGVWSLDASGLGVGDLSRRGEHRPLVGVVGSPFELLRCKAGTVKLIRRHLTSNVSVLVLVLQKESPSWCGPVGPNGSSHTGPQTLNPSVGQVKTALPCRLHFLMTPFFCFKVFLKLPLTYDMDIQDMDSQDCQPSSDKK